MNRKDFEEIARIIRKVPADQLRTTMGRYFASEFDGHHHGFDKARFLKACGIETEKAP